MEQQSTFFVMYSCFQCVCMAVVCLCVLVCVRDALNPICCSSMSVFWFWDSGVGLSVPARVNYSVSLEFSVWTCHERHSCSCRVSHCVERLHIIWWQRGKHGIFHLISPEAQAESKNSVALTHQNRIHTVDRWIDRGTFWPAICIILCYFYMHFPALILF